MTGQTTAFAVRPPVDRARHNLIEAALQLHGIRHADLRDRFYVPEFSRVDDLPDAAVAGRLAEIGVLL